ncbi:MAG: thiamine pyrophosphate-dependent enzyme [Spirochaetota bacterium]|nr:thiamine pyrophosphate-dependent enzyme [Spirochaetota bacterium]
MKKTLSGNAAVAYGALEAGVAVAAGYPGTPSSEALTELLRFAGSNDPAPYVEWSANEKVALEVAVGAAWAGQRAMATMKMSGANVALDTLISAAYSGTTGGLVVYIADDPGAEAGMPEQDTRMTALFTNLPVLEPSNPRQAYRLVQTAFELSEQIQLPVILRSVTTLAHAVETFDIDGGYHPLDRAASFTRDINRFTKAGAKICLDQHRTLLERNELALDFFRTRGLNRLAAGASRADAAEQSEGGHTAVNRSSNRAAVSPLKDHRAAVISAGVLNQTMAELHPEYPELTVVYLEAVLPADEDLFSLILEDSDRVLVLEELEPVIERQLRSAAQRTGWTGRIIGKEDGVLPRVGRYGTNVVLRGLGELTSHEGAGKADNAGYSAPAPEDQPARNDAADLPGVKHPITFCEGCPHRGTYMALNHALRTTRLGQKKTVVTGDIGCTILGMNPPFNSCWTEISMGSSIGAAQGFSRAGIRKPVVATIGDSTFFHAGIPQLINAVQHRTELLLIVLDNGWTSMTGFQVNPGTAGEFQPDAGRRVDMEKIIAAVGVDMLKVMDPFDQKASTAILEEALTAEGVRVVISKAECALTRMRREAPRFKYVIDPEKCTFCKACILQTGCPALFIEEGAGGGKAANAAVETADDASVPAGPGAEQPAPEQPAQSVAIDWNICTGCSLCYSTCRFDAIQPKAVQRS